MVQKLTQEGYDKLAAELEKLKTDGRREAADNIKEARSHGDLSENSEYDEAMNDQAKMEARITELENILKDAVIIVTDESEDIIHLGSIVTLKDLEDDFEDDFVIIGENESAVSGNYISGESPVGKELIGKTVGDTITAEAPGGVVKYTVIAIKK